MSYSFDFDLTKVSRSFFRDMARFVDDKDIHRKLGNTSRSLVNRLNIDGITGVPMGDAIQLMEDMVEIYVKNLSKREGFRETENRALFLPHCSRKYMDRRCQAVFNKKYSSYECRKCSEDCLIRKATELGEKKGYDVYVFPGSSCIPKVLRDKKYDGVVGVACSEEIKLGGEKLEKAGVDYQGVPLLKNGCSDTRFNLKTLKELL